MQAKQLVFQSYYRLLDHEFSNGSSLRPVLGKDVSCFIFVGSKDRASSQQLQMWSSEHFFASKPAALFVTPIVSTTVEQIWHEKMSEKPHFI